LCKSLNIDVITKNIQYDILINTIQNLTESSTKRRNACQKCQRAKYSQITGRNNNCIFRTVNFTTMPLKEMFKHNQLIKNYLTG